MKTQPYRHPMIHAARMVLGWAMIVLGLVGLFLPFLQGVLFLVIGTILLAPHVRVFRRLSVSLQRRFPRIRKVVRRQERRDMARQDAGSEPSD